MSEAESGGERETRNGAQETETAPETERGAAAEAARRAAGRGARGRRHRAGRGPPGSGRSEEAGPDEAGGGGRRGRREEEPDEGGCPPEQLEGVVESLLFASDKPLGLEDLKVLDRGEDARAADRGRWRPCGRAGRGRGVEVAEVAGGYTLRTRAAFAPWVSKLLAGPPGAPVAGHARGGGHHRLPAADHAARARRHPRGRLRAGAQDPARPEPHPHHRQEGGGRPSHPLRHHPRVPARLQPEGPDPAADPAAVPRAERRASGNARGETRPRPTSTAAGDGGPVVPRRRAPRRSLARAFLDPPGRAPCPRAEAHPGGRPRRDADGIRA